jgi:hypothetical protein
LQDLNPWPSYSRQQLQAVPGLEAHPQSCLHPLWVICQLSLNATMSYETGSELRPMWSLTVRLQDSGILKWQDSLQGQTSHRRSLLWRLGYQVQLLWIWQTSFASLLQIERYWEVRLENSWQGRPRGTQWWWWCSQTWTKWFRIPHIGGQESIAYTVPFRPSVQSQVTNNFELSTSGVSSQVTGSHEHLSVSIFAIFWPTVPFWPTVHWVWCMMC